MMYTGCFINLDRFKLIRRLGKGSFGEVYQVSEINTGKYYTAKISTSMIDKNLEKQDIFNLCREINLLHMINHQAIIKFIGYSPIKILKG